MHTRHFCPRCNSKEKTFTLYIDAETGQPLHSTVGRCNREINCGYHYTPKQYFQNNNIQFETMQQTTWKAPSLPPKTSYIDSNILYASLNSYDNNNFVSFLNGLFGKAITSELIGKYFIGTSKHWLNSTIFWQIDTKGKIRDGKIIQYEIKPEIKSVFGNDCKRVKTNYPPVQWVHSVTKQPQFELKQCLFGEHLLSDKKKTVAIVESEKTAIISSVYYPQFIWLATGSLTNLNVDKCIVLYGRKIVLFPDLNGFEKWSVKAKELNEKIPGTRFKVSDLLESLANEEERSKGLDLADFLIRFDWGQFRIKSEVEQINIDPLPEEPTIFDTTHDK